MCAIHAWYAAIQVVEDTAHDVDIDTVTVRRIFHRANAKIYGILMKTGPDSTIEVIITWPF